MAPPSLVLRPSAARSAGTGHLARVYAIAQGWVAKGGTAVLWAREAPDPWDERFAAIGVKTAEARPSSHFDWVVLDGYEFTASDHNESRALAAHVLVVDDHCSVGEYSADLVVDQNLDAPQAGYDRTVPLLAGPRYALLRSEFAAARPATVRAAAEVRRIAYLVGGSPSSDVQALAQSLVSAPELARFAPLQFDDQRAFASTLATADLAVSAAGTTALELCCLGLPSILFSVADNQRPVAAALAAAGVAIDAGDAQDVDVGVFADIVASVARDQATRDGLARRAWALVDGRGVARVTARMRARLLSLRPATMEDASNLFEWRTDPLARRGSFSDGEIEWSDHVDWLRDRLADPASRLFIAEDGTGAALGQVRFDLAQAGAEAVISVGLAPAARGRGLGASMIVAGVDQLFDTTGARSVLAYIKDDNAASVSSFIQADFEYSGAATVGAQPALLYSRQRDAART